MRSEVLELKLGELLKDLSLESWRLVTTKHLSSGLCISTLLHSALGKLGIWPKKLDANVDGLCRVVLGEELREDGLLQDVVELLLELELMDLLGSDVLVDLNVV